MRLDDINPIETTTGSRGETVLNHPAFAQIGASRVSSTSASLYGSEFNHHHYMTITIRRSELHRDLSRDWPFGREELVQVALSEAQWASFVSSPNVGSGVQCTLSRFNGEGVPGIIQPKSKSDRFADEIKLSVEKLQADIQKLADELDGPLSKTKVIELKRQIGWMSERVGNSAAYIATKFDEHMEETTEKAKIEVNAYVMNAVQRAGLDAIAEKSMLALNEHRNDAE